LSAENWRIRGLKRVVHLVDSPNAEGVRELQPRVARFCIDRRQG
jgi:hypothetical protein